MRDLVQLSSTLSSTAGPPAELIFGDWYPALRSRELRVGEMTTALLLGVPLVLGRKKDGSIFAMRDLCPHRGIPLSAGWFDGENVQCKYHGWKFEPCSGQCTEIPSLTSHDGLEPGKIYAGAYPCEERDGYAWVYVPERLEREGRLASCPQFRSFLNSRASFVRRTLLLICLATSITGSLGLMDPAHGPFVHQAWWWRSRASIHEKTKHFEPIHQGLQGCHRMHRARTRLLTSCWVFMGGPITTTIDCSSCRTAGTRRFGRAEKWFASLTTVTPVTPSTCRIDVLSAWNVFYNVPFVTPIAKFFGEKFVGQDQQTMIEQAEGLRYHPGLMLIDDADKPAKWYFALKQARLKGTGEHPLAGPVTLHWRS